MRVQSLLKENKQKTINVLVVGMGAFAFGRAKRAVRMLQHMSHVKPYFLVSKYEDGSVSTLLERYGFEYERVPFGYLGRARPTWTLITLSQVPKLWLQVLRAYRRERCEGVLLLCLHPLINAFGSLLVLKYLYHADIVPYFGDIPQPNRVHRWIGRLINRWCDRALVNSQVVKRGLVQIGVDEGKIRVVYNGVDVQRFENAKPLDFRRQFGWPPCSILVGYIGQFTENKGAWDFVRAAELVLCKNQDCRFVLIGKLIAHEPGQREILDYISRKRLQTHVRFVGWIEEIEAAYAGLDIVVVPSRYEDPAPNVNIEAMAAGVPVVATRVGGTPELLADGEAGLLVEKNCPDQIAEQILRLAGDPQLREKMGKAGQSRVRQLFDVHRNAQQVERVILYG